MNHTKHGNQKKAKRTVRAVRRIFHVFLFGLCAFCFFPLQIFAQELANPAEKDFAGSLSVSQSEAKTSGGFAQKTPVFNDRGLPAEQVGTLQVSAADPFTISANAIPANAIPTEETPAMNTVAMNSLGMQYGTMNHPAADYAAQLAQQQFAQTQWMQYQQPQYQQQFQPQQFAPEYAAAYLNVNPYAQYDNVIDPYTAMQMNNSMPNNTMQMEAQQNYQNMSDYTSLYQFLLQQELSRRQEQEKQIQSGTGEEKNETGEEPASNWTMSNLVPVRVSSPLGASLLSCAKTISPFASPTGPDKGVGMPLVNKSWLDHPWYFGGFVGTMCGSQLVAEMIDQDKGATGGLIAGYNFNEYWGLESRLHFASLDISDTERAKQLIAELYPDITVLPITRTNKLTLIDASVHYYPLGNAKWRPFFKYGLGIGKQRFVDTFGNDQSADIFTMPLGLGLRYWWNERIAVQFDLVDNIIFSSGIAKTQNNITFSVGLTYSFGTGTKKKPIHYWPATPSLGSKW